MVIDGGSYTNVVSKDDVKKLGLKAEPHLNLYKVTWVNNNSLKVQERCLVPYSIGDFNDKVQCDIIFFNVCYTSYLGDHGYSIRRCNILATTTRIHSSTTTK